VTPEDVYRVPAPAAIPEDVLLVTVGIGTTYCVRRVYVGESVTDLIVERRVGDGSMSDLTGDCEELYRVAEDAQGFMRAAAVVTAEVVRELAEEEGVEIAPEANPDPRNGA
jgi:hypothetical protein